MLYLNFAAYSNSMPKSQEQGITNKKNVIKSQWITQAHFDNRSSEQLDKTLQIYVII